MSEEKKKKKGAWNLFDYDYKTGKITLKNKKCPRCGRITAHHQNPERWACGNCGYTEYVGKSSRKS